MQITPRGLVTNGIKDTKHYWYLLIAILLSIVIILLFPAREIQAFWLIRVERQGL